MVTSNIISLRDSQANDEKPNRFGHICITDLNDEDIGATATILFGGIDHTYVGIRLEAPEEGGRIYSQIQIYEYIDEPTEEDDEPEDDYQAEDAHQEDSQESDWLEQN